jgi:hypothetical protein
MTFCVIHQQPKIYCLIHQRPNISILALLLQFVLYHHHSRLAVTVSALLSTLSLHYRL